MPTDDATLLRQRRALEIVAEAYDVPDDARAAFVAEACAGDAALLHAVQALLAVDDQSHDFLDGGMVGVLDASPPPAEDVGGYRVVGELGRGGMGVVYAAERVDGTFEKTVALKLVQSAKATPETARRFARERRVLARLDHPGIARLLDGGVTPDGRPYFIMERVEGEPITRYADARGLDLEQRLRLALDACDAVAHAHRLLIVHRDLKPSNVFVGEDETGAPRVKLLDFGIAKALDEDDEDVLTRTGGALTPAYAAPEQVSGDPVTASTDVYALGVILYELLVGRRPYSFPSYALAEVARVVREADPTRPSDAAETASGGGAGRGKGEEGRGDGSGDSGAPAANGDVPLAPEAPRWAAAPARLRGDLDAIVLQALRKEPERRYATAADLADDLRRHLDGRPVLARGDGLGYRASRFVRRHRAAVAASGALVLALLVGVGAVLWQARETAREAARANATLDYVLGMFEAVDPVELEGGELTPEALLAPGLRRAAALDDQPLVQASLLEGLGRLGVGLGVFATADSVLQRAIDLRRREQGADHPDVALPLTLLARSLTEEGRYDEAKAAAQ
ncbi:MAG: serine/threonine-protein kinase, partial [Bacteroidota bacterium]